VNRTDFVAGRTFNRFSWYGRPGALVEQFSVIVGFAPIWRYRDFGRLNRTIEDTLETFWIANLRGGWQAQVTLNLNHFGFESADYAATPSEARPSPCPTTVSPPRRGVHPQHTKPGGVGEYGGRLLGQSIFPEASEAGRSP